MSSRRARGMPPSPPPTVPSTQEMEFSTDNLDELMCTARTYMMQAKNKDDGEIYRGYKYGRTGDMKDSALSANAGDIVEYIEGIPRPLRSMPRPRRRPLPLQLHRLHRLPRGAGRPCHLRSQAIPRVHPPGPRRLRQGRQGEGQALRHHHREALQALPRQGPRMPPSPPPAA